MNPSKKSAKKPAKKRLGKGLSAMLDAGATSRPAPVLQPSAVPEPESQAINAQPGSAPQGALVDQKLSDVPSAADVRDRSQNLSGKDVTPGVRRIPLESIRPGRHQPRAVFDDAALESLASSIRSVGVIQPITVRPDPDGEYELVAGERRWRASRLAGLEDIPALVVDIDEQSAAETALIENLQREDLNPIERADAIRRLIDTFGFSQSVVAERVGLDRSSVSNLLRLAELEAPVRDMLATGLLGLGHGKALLSLPEGPARVETATRASREGWSVRRLEEEARRLKQRGETPGTATRNGTVDDGMGDVETRALEKRLGEHLGTKVSLRVDRSGKGAIQLRFFDLDHFDDLMSRIGFDPGSSD